MLFIFDWDGTLIDSIDKIVTSLQLAVEELGLPERSDDQARNIIGLAQTRGPYAASVPRIP